MRYKEINPELKEIYFVFFYSFSRFEFCLKEYNFHKDNPKKLIPLEACWDKFIKEFDGGYKISAWPAAEKLKNLSPQKQMLCPKKGVYWGKIYPKKPDKELRTTVRMLKEVRNNLFHGGKETNQETCDMERNVKILSTGKEVLDELVELAESKLPGFKADYTGYY